MMDVRARLTPVDVVFYGVALLLLSFMAEPIYTTLRDNADRLGTGEAYLFQLIFPAMILTLISVVYLTGASGGAR
jgi:ABC-type transport system involved in cytochrome c biogenesis permease subunit